MVMRARVELLRQVALSADAVAGRPQLLPVGIVTVRAGDALRRHPAGEERAVVVDLVAHLAVGPVQPRLDQRRPEGVVQRLAGHVIIGELAAPGMAACADLDLRRRRPGNGPAGAPGFGIEGPADAVPFIEPGQQTIPAALTVATRPGHVRLARAVAGLAGDVDFRPGRVEGIAPGVVILAQVGGVAVRALVVPVLVDAGPVQRIARADVLAGVEVKPALAACVRRTGIPGDGQRLQPAARKLDQVLLQRIDAEGVADPEVLQRAVRAVGPDLECLAVTKEAGLDARAREHGAIEVARDRGRRGVSHRNRVLRALPGRIFSVMAAGAGRAAHVGGRRCAHRRLP